MPPAPPPPAQVDPGESSLDFIRGMANPELQNELLAAEKTYRPEYNKLELADINTLLRGGGGQEGLLAQQEFAAREMQRYGSELNTAQRTADIEDVERLGSRASDAFLGANPELTRSLSEAEALRGGGMSVENDIRGLMSQGVPQAQAAQIAQSRLGGGLQQAALGQLGGTAAEAQLTRAGMGQFRSSDEEALLGQLSMGQLQQGAGEMQLGQAGLGQLQQAGMGEMKLNQRGMDLLNRGAGASPLQTRNAVQQARIASQARGRLGDQSSIYGEIGARLSADLDLESRNLGLGSADFLQVRVLIWHGAASEWSRVWHSIQGSFLVRSLGWVSSEPEEHPIFFPKGSGWGSNVSARRRACSVKSLAWDSSDWEQPAAFMVRI
jgi:hypothetical protein